MTNIQINGQRFKTNTAWPVHNLYLWYADAPGGADSGYVRAFDPASPAGVNNGTFGVTVNQWTDAVIDFDFTPPAGKYASRVDLYNEDNSKLVSFNIEPDQPMSLAGGSGYASVMPTGDLMGNVSRWFSGLSAKSTGEVGLAIPRAGGDGFMAAVLDATGTLDTAFSTDGVAVEDLGYTNITSVASAWADDGKLYVAGNHDRGGYMDIGIMRFNADGTLDTGFGTAGITYTNLGANFTVLDLLVVPAGHTAASGVELVAVVYNQGNANVALLSFADDGSYLQIANIGAFTDVAHAHFSTLGTTDPIILTTRNGAADVVVGRFDVSAGGAFSVDASFGGGDGIAEVNFGGLDFYSLPRLALDAANNAVVSTEAYVVDHDQWIVGRITTGGIADNTFGGGDGYVEIDVPDLSASAATYGRGVGIQSDGKIVAAGFDVSGEVSLGTRVVLVRLDTSGNVDTTFGTNGFAFFDTGAAYNDDTELVVLADDSIIVKSWQGNTDDLHIAKFTSNGTLDTTYGD